MSDGEKEVFVEGQQIRLKNRRVILRRTNKGRWEMWFKRLEGKEVKHTRIVGTQRSPQ